jgi:hypothetical protein
VARATWAAWAATKPSEKYRGTDHQERGGEQSRPRFFCFDLCRSERHKREIFVECQIKHISSSVGATYPDCSLTIFAFPERGDYYVDAILKVAAKRF